MIKCALIQVVIVVVCLSELRLMCDFVKGNHTNTKSLHNRELIILLVLTLFSFQGDIASSISTTSEKTRLYC